MPAESNKFINLEIRGPFTFPGLIGPATKMGTTFYLDARRNLSDGLFYFKNVTQIKWKPDYVVPITEDAFSLLKFSKQGKQTRKTWKYTCYSTFIIF